MHWIRCGLLLQTEQRGLSVCLSVGSWVVQERLKRSICCLGTDNVSRASTYEMTVMHRMNTFVAESGDNAVMRSFVNFFKNEIKSIYIAPFYMLCIMYISKRSGMDHTVSSANTPCLPFLRNVHQMAPPVTEVEDIQLQLTTHLSTPKGWKTELAWLTHSGRFTCISGHPSATGRAQNRESSTAEDRRSTTVPRNHL